MATSKAYIEYVCGQLPQEAAIRYRKMFGEYLVYINEKPLLLVCDNTVYVKMLPEFAPLLEGEPTGFPYEGAKEHYLLNPEETEHFRNTVRELERLP